MSEIGGLDMNIIHKKSLKANFIIPSWHYWKEPLRAQPLTQLYLATLLEEKGVNVEFTDFRDGPKEVNKADMYLYTIASPDLKEVQGIVKNIRKQYPKAKHIAGGPHPSILPFKTEGFDSIVIGRGEKALDRILQDLSSNTLSKTYDIHRDNKEYSFPKRHFLSKEKIVNNNLFKTDNIKSTTAQFSFGCPFECSFCANYTRGKTRRNSLEKISEEIDYLKSEYGIEGLALQDEICLPKNTKAYLNMLTSKNIKWRGQVRANINYKTLKQAKESGLVELSFGLESCDQDVLDFANKHIKVEDVERTINYCKDNDIKTRIYLLNGLPGEKEDIVQKTINFIDKNNPDLVLLSSLQPYPGSPIAENPKKYGIKSISKEYDKFNHLLCRFDDSGDNPNNAVPYEFEKGKGLSKNKIMNNMLKLQSYLRGKGMNK